MVKKFITYKEAADYIGLQEDELQKIVDRGKLPSYNIGGVYTRFKVDDLDFYRKKGPKKFRQKHSSNIADKIKDFFYFNDFYIFSGIAIVVILYFIFK